MIARSRRSRLLITSAALGLAGSAAFAFAADAPANAADRPYDALPYTPSLDVSAMDRSADPCEDLYTYACGGWQKSNPIPSDRATWSVYGKLYEDNQHYLWGVLEAAAKGGAGRTPSAQKIGDYFAACMDTDAIEKAGIAPLRPDLDRIAALSDRDALGAMLGELHERTGSGDIFFGPQVQQDAQDASKQIAGIVAGGLGLPDRDYDVKDDPKSVETREHYVAHVARVFTLLGDTPQVAQANAATVMRIETALAKASLTQVDKRDPYKIYHRETLASLQKMAPELDWAAYFKAGGLQPEPWLNVEEPEFMKELNARLKDAKLADLQAYLRWSVAAAAAPYLSGEFANEDFAFNRAYLRGVEADEARWKKCVGWIDRDLGEALGKEFVAHVFPAEMKAKTVQMTDQIEAAMKTRIQQLDWMSQDTKAQALEKLAAMRNKVGYPEIWRDYTALSVTPADFFGDVSRALAFESRRQAAKIGKPVDHGEWGMSPPTVNAYYNPQMNDINFPAGVLQPPLYDPKMDDAPNYGNTGGTIGHELTHGFDDQGRQFDAQGNLKDWWTPDDGKAFEERAACISDQYAQYVIVDDIKINSKLTLGEDVADVGGLVLAWMAWKAETVDKKLEDRDGMTPEQRFFVGYAQWACENDRPENLRVKALTDPHSPGKYRVNGLVVNMPEFEKAFSCKAGSPMAAVKRCRVW
jgi:putative endopeptidase